ncbi:RNA polymerase sigma factor [Clostridium sediminicola]|uniref:RNA polymerase sigma factor n=1 Tax=Clostridium sediminicola TaxID=3114879 RepID=UPI0031F25125
MKIEYLNEDCLIQALRKKDDEAFKFLLKNYGSSILKLCFSILKDIHLAEDIVQETFVKVYNKIGEFNERSSLYTWICKIAVNECRGRLRKQKKEKLFFKIPEIKSKDNVEEQTIKNIEGSKIRKIIFSLKPIYREILTLYYISDFSVKDISRITGEKESTIKSRLKRGRDIVKDEIIEEVRIYEEK